MASLVCKVFRRLQSTAAASQLKTIRYVNETLHKHVSALQSIPSSRGIDTSKLKGHKMSDSHDSAVIPLSSESQLRLQYMNYKELVRFGKLLEDLDTFAIWLSYKHNQGNQPMGQPQHHPMIIVTAAVDQIYIKPNYDILPTSDILMEGFVSWVGKSSLQVSMHLSQQIKDTRVKFLSAKFITVSREPSGERSAKNIPLITSTPEEEALVKEALAGFEVRKEDEVRSLLRTPPTEKEREILHDFFLKTVDHDSHSFQRHSLPPHHVWLENAKLKNAIICFPMDRNVYGKIFGGYLMRLAYELAWSNATLYSKARCDAVAVDDIVFRRPVEIGSLLLLSSQVCYTQGDRLELSVHAEVADVQRNQVETSNTFYFMFKSAHYVPSIVPKSYTDGMLYLKAKRRFDRSEERLRKSTTTTQW